MYSFTKCKRPIIIKCKPATWQGHEHPNYIKNQSVKTKEQWIYYKAGYEFKQYAVGCGKCAICAHQKVENKKSKGFSFCKCYCKAAAESGFIEKVIKTS